MRSTDPSLPEIPFPKWRQEYESALRETDGKTLFKRIEVAEASIRMRKEILAHSSDHHPERQAMEDALVNLQRLKRDRLNWR